MRSRAVFLFVSLALVAPATAQSRHESRATEQQLAAKKHERRAYVVQQRRWTWEWQQEAGLPKSPAGTSPSRASLPYLHHLARLWHHRHREAMAYAKKHPHASLNGGLRAPGGSSVALGQAMAALYGWVGSEWAALYTLWNYESGWSTTAHNSRSDACGIPQAMNDCAYGYDAATQIAWGLSYIKNRPGYGAPSAALAHFYSYGWY